MECNNTIFDVIQKYLDFGWIELTTIFTNEKSAKQKSVIGGVNEDLLRMLGCIRTYTVEQVFLCSLKKVRGNKKDMKYTAYGSTNVTSDYDITLTGRKAPEVMITMFHQFLKRYDNLLPKMFDTNVYCAGMYSLQGMNQSTSSNIQKIGDGRRGIILSKNIDERRTQNQFAALSLLESDITHQYCSRNQLPNVSNLLLQTKKLQKELKSRTQKETLKQRNRFPGKNKDTIDVIVNYELTYSYAKKLFKQMYSRSSGLEKNKLVRFACMAQYYSVESYYTPATFNIVVMHLQAGEKKIKITKNDFLCSVLENLGHFRKHTLHHFTKTNEHSILLKNSKYLYRMYYSLMKLVGPKHSSYRMCMDLVQILKQDVVPFRSHDNGRSFTSNILLKVGFKTNLGQFVEKHTSQILRIIEEKHELLL